jgi:hypothetical protein
MAAKLIRLTYKIAIQLNLVAESCTILWFSLQGVSPESFGYTFVDSKDFMESNISFLLCKKLKCINALSSGAVFRYRKVRLAYGNTTYVCLPSLINFNQLTYFYEYPVVVVSAAPYSTDLAAYPDIGFFLVFSVPPGNSGKGSSVKVTTSSFTNHHRRVSIKAVEELSLIN